MSLRADEITSILKKEIENYEAGLEIEEVGSVIQVGDGIAHVYGLSKAMESELLEFPGGTQGLILNLNETDIGCVLLGPYTHIKEGDIVKRTGRIAEVPAGEALLGRVVNPLGEPIDGKGPILTDRRRPVEFKAPGVFYRHFTNYIGLTSQFLFP